MEHVRRSDRRRAEPPNAERADARRQEGEEFERTAVLDALGQTESDAGIGEAAERTEAHGLARLAREYIDARRRLGTLISPDVFADPALEILLDLFVAERTNRSISVSSACIASGVPSSTASAWVKRLEGAGLIARRPDAEDGRRTFLTLTGSTSDAIASWLARMGS